MIGYAIRHKTSGKLYGIKFKEFDPLKSKFVPSLFSTITAAKICFNAHRYNYTYINKQYTRTLKVTLDYEIVEFTAQLTVMNTHSCERK